MLLRSASVPSLGALIAEGDRHECHPLSNATYRSSRAHFGINRASPARRSFKPSLAMRRACSETELQGMICGADTTEDQVAGEKTSHAKNHRSLETLSSSEVRDRTIVSLTDRVRPTLTEEDFHRRSTCSGTIHISSSCANGHSSVAEIGSISPIFMADGLSASSKADDLLANIEEDFGGRGSNGGGYGGSGGPSGSSHGDSDLTDLRYRKLLQADPQNPLLLRNYAQYLSETKLDYMKSEEYYERAILACPSDGEVLSTYAKHMWDVHKDVRKAGIYFDQAVQATPDDCYVLASYASFLWQSEEDEELNVAQSVFPSSHSTCTTSHSLMASA